MQPFRWDSVARIRPSASMALMRENWSRRMSCSPPRFPSFANRRWASIGDQSGPSSAAHREGVASHNRVKYIMQSFLLDGRGIGGRKARSPQDPQIHSRQLANSRGKPRVSVRIGCGQSFIAATYARRRLVQPRFRAVHDWHANRAQAAGHRRTYSKAARSRQHNVNRSSSRSRSRCSSRGNLDPSRDSPTRRRSQHPAVLRDEAVVRSACAVREFGSRESFRASIKCFHAPQNPPPSGDPARDFLRMPQGNAGHFTAAFFSHACTWPLLILPEIDSGHSDFNDRGSSLSSRCRVRAALSFPAPRGASHFRNILAARVARRTPLGELGNAWPQRPKPART